MATERIKGDYIGTTFKDFLIEPDHTSLDCTPDEISTETDLAGVKIGRPFLPAAMQSVVRKEMGLKGSKDFLMPVAPRGLPVEQEVAIIEHVKQNEVKPGDIEIEKDPVHLLDNATLGEAIDTAHEHGHSNFPVKNRMAELVGMFTYRPTVHDLEDPMMPITQTMSPLKGGQGNVILPVCRSSATQEEIKRYMREQKLRMVPILDEHDRLEALIFMQQEEAYKIGAAIDTRKGWQRRAEAVIIAGADMLFIDTADAHSDFAGNIVLEYIGKLGDAGAVVTEYQRVFADGPPLCAGNIVTRKGARFLLEAGADVLKEGHGPGSICTTNAVLGVGASPFYSLVEVTEERDQYEKETERYVPVIADGGIEDTWDINVALTFADAIMGGRIFAGFHESAGELIKGPNGEKSKVYFGEGSRWARMRAGNLDRYQVGEQQGHGLYQGVPGTVPFEGYLKPGVERYSEALREAMSHVGAHNLSEYRTATLVRLSEEARRLTSSHGIKVIGE